MPDFAEYFKNLAAKAYKIYQAKFPTKRPSPLQEGGYRPRAGISGILEAYDVPEDMKGPHAGFGPDGSGDYGMHK